VYGFAAAAPRHAVAFFFILSVFQVFFRPAWVTRGFPPPERDDMPPVFFILGMPRRVSKNKSEF
jgi:hypothetical protein